MRTRPGALTLWRPTYAEYLGWSRHIKGLSINSLFSSLFAPGGQFLQRSGSSCIMIADCQTRLAASSLDGASNHGIQLKHKGLVHYSAGLQHCREGPAGRADSQGMSTPKESTPAPPNPTANPDATAPDAEDDDLMADVKSLAGGAPSKDTLAQLEDALRPVEKYAVAFLEAVRHTLARYP